jgi:hypothetical protein
MSPVFRRVPAYRRFFDLYQDMNLGIANILGDHLQMPIGRTYDLYELWCYLRIVRAATLIYGASQVDTQTLFIPVSRSRSVTINAENARVILPNGIMLIFQRSYREFWLTADRRGSFSRTMRPDIAIEFMDHHTAGRRTDVIVLDAKYRVASQLNPALASLHMYRDALVQADEHDNVRRIVKAAYLLTPEAGATTDEWKDAPMPGRLFHPEYISTFRFGAVTLTPALDLHTIGLMLKAIITDAIGL